MSQKHYTQLSYEERVIIAHEGLNLRSVAHCTKKVIIKVMSVPLGRALEVGA